MRILVLEDDLLIGLDLAGLLEGCGHEVVGPCESLAEAHASLGGSLDFALLDIDLPDGKSFGLAARLLSEGIPFAFVSASHRGELPDALRASPFIAKPYSHAAIRNSLSLGERLAG